MRAGPREEAIRLGRLLAELAPASPRSTGCWR